MIENFTKDMLQTGMVIKNREGDYRLVINNMLVGENYYGDLYLYSDDMRSGCNHEFDVMEVYTKIKVLRDIKHINPGRLLWTRKEPREITMGEIEEKFGCKVKIVNKP